MTLEEDVASSAIIQSAIKISNVVNAPLDENALIFETNVSMNGVNI
uniref:Uncharacterized protein n=1 Tax=Arundo donax TaxID=35708 RepID=A0A0A9HAQ3_ARUDO